MSQAQSQHVLACISVWFNDLTRCRGAGNNGGRLSPAAWSRQQQQSRLSQSQQAKLKLSSSLPRLPPEHQVSTPSQLLLMKQK